MKIKTKLSSLITLVLVTASFGVFSGASAHAKTAFEAECFFPGKKTLRIKNGCDGNLYNKARPRTVSFEECNLESNRPNSTFNILQFSSVHSTLFKTTVTIHDRCWLTFKSLGQVTRQAERNQGTASVHAVIQTSSDKLAGYCVVSPLQCDGVASGGNH